MKRLLLLRHAKSSWDEPDLPDRDRPLAKRGKRDAPWIAQRLRKHLRAPELIIASAARRALATARLVAQELGTPAGAIAVAPELYLAAPAEILAVAARQADERAGVMLVGHNPGMTELANRLLPELALDNIPTAGLLAVDFRVADWASVPTTRAAFVYYDWPKNPGAPLRGSYP